MSLIDAALRLGVGMVTLSRAERAEHDPTNIIRAVRLGAFD